MPEVKLEIGGRTFPVVCEPGEEEQLAAAAARLDGEASTLMERMGRIPEGRMLLLAGLMLADRIVDAERAAKLAADRAAALELDLRRAEERAAERAQGAPSAEALAEAEAEADAAKATLGRAAERLESVAEMLEAL